MGIFLSIIIRTIVNIYETRNCIGNERPENMTPTIEKFIEYLKYKERVPAIELIVKKEKTLYNKYILGEVSLLTKKYNTWRRVTYDGLQKN